MERWDEEVLLVSFCLVFLLLFCLSPANRHHFVVNQPPVMTDTSVGHRSKLN